MSRSAFGIEKEIVRLQLARQLLADASTLNMQDDEDELQRAAGIVNKLIGRLMDQLDGAVRWQERERQKTLEDSTYSFEARANPSPMGADG